MLNATRQPHGPHGQPLLIVEDEPRLREMLVQATREMGFQPTGAATAEQALRILEHHPCPVVIFDLNLPLTGGMEMLRMIRRRRPQMQAIVLTGFGDLAAAREAIRLEVVDFLTKPCALGDLEAAIGRAFARLSGLHPHALDPELDDEELDEADEYSHVQRAPAFTPRSDTPSLSMDELERQAILTTVKRHAGNRAAAAAELGISIRKLYYRLGEYKKHGYIE